MKKLLLPLLLLGFLPAHSLTRSTGLPKGFLWSYFPDEKATQPRGGMAWRAGLMIEESIYLLSTETLVSLDLQGQKRWIYRLPQEGMNSEAKLLPFGKDLVVITTETVLKVDRETGEQRAVHVHDSKRRAAFQRTLILPRYSFIFEGNIYGFIGPTLLKFDGSTLERSEVYSFGSSPKTLPLLYRGRVALGLDNGFLELFDLKTGQKETLISGSPRKDFSIRQPVIYRDFLFVPATDELVAYEGSEIYARNGDLTNAILSSVEGRLWMRGHNTGIISELDETLSLLREGRYASPLRAGSIDAPLAGTEEELLHLEALNGALTLIDVSGSKPLSSRSIVSEDFGDNPPLALLGSKGSLALIGGFDGAFLIDLKKF